MEPRPQVPLTIDDPVVLVLMGVSGCGKSTVAALLAGTLGWPFEEGDALHPQANIDKMATGHPLTDEDRWPWLSLVADWIDERLDAGENGVITCSALKRSYRDALRDAQPALRFVHLALTENQALQRVAARAGHFYPPSLVASQFQALEDPAREPGVVVIQASLPLDEVVAHAVRGLADQGSADSTIRN